MYWYCALCRLLIHLPLVGMGPAYDLDGDQSRPISQPQNDSVDEGHQQQNWCTC